MSIKEISQNLEVVKDDKHPFSYFRTKWNDLNNNVKYGHCEISKPHPSIYSEYKNIRQVFIERCFRIAVRKWSFE